MSPFSAQLAQPRRPLPGLVTRGTRFGRRGFCCSDSRSKVQDVDQIAKEAMPCDDDQDDPRPPRTPTASPPNMNCRANSRDNHSNCSVRQERFARLTVELLHFAKFSLGW